MSLPEPPDNLEAWGRILAPVGTLASVAVALWLALRAGRVKVRAVLSAEAIAHAPFYGEREFVVSIVNTGSRDVAFTVAEFAGLVAAPERWCKCRYKRYEVPLRLTGWGVIELKVGASHSVNLLRLSATDNQATAPPLGFIAISLAPRLFSRPLCRIWMRERMGERIPVRIGRSARSELARMRRVSGAAPDVASERGMGDDVFR